MTNKEVVLFITLPFISISGHIWSVCVPDVCLAGGNPVYCVGRKGRAEWSSGAVLSVSDVPTRHHQPPPCTAYCLGTSAGVRSLVLHTKSSGWLRTRTILMVSVENKMPVVSKTENCINKIKYILYIYIETQVVTHHGQS